MRETKKNSGRLIKGGIKLSPDQDGIFGGISTGK
jgi:hypothetical protein